jgi:hypothetical protein
MSIREGQPSDTLSATAKKIKRGFRHPKRARSNGFGRMGLSSL